MLELAGAETASRVGKLEWPQEVASLLEVGANGINLVDQIFHADNTKFAKVVLNDLVVGETNTLLVDLAVSTLVDKLTDSLQARITVGNVGVDDGKHLSGGLGEANEDTVVDLDEAEKLEDLAWLRGNLIDTSKDVNSCSRRDVDEVLPLDADDENELGLFGNVEGALLSAQTSETDLLALGIAVLLDIGLSTLEDDTALLLVGLEHED